MTTSNPETGSMPTPNLPACPLCGGRKYRMEEVRQESAWGFQLFRMNILICENCQYVLYFAKGRSIFDLD